MEVVEHDHTGAGTSTILTVPTGKTYTVLACMVAKDNANADVEIHDGTDICHLPGKAGLNYAFQNDIAVRASGNIDLTASGSAGIQVHSHIWYVPYDIDNITSASSELFHRPLPILTTGDIITGLLLTVLVLFNVVSILRREL